MDINQRDNIIHAKDSKGTTVNLIKTDMSVSVHIINFEEDQYFVDSSVYVDIETGDTYALWFRSGQSRYYRVNFGVVSQYYIDAESSYFINFL